MATSRLVTNAIEKNSKKIDEFRVEQRAFAKRLNEIERRFDILIPRKNTKLPPHLQKSLNALKYLDKEAYGAQIANLTGRQRGSEGFVLRQLEAMGRIKSRKEGSRIYYRLVDE